MIGNLIALAAIAASLTALPAKGAPSLSWDEAVAKVAECAGMTPETAKELSAKMVADEHRPAELLIVKKHFVVLQPSATKCWIVTGADVVSFPKNTTRLAQATLTEEKTGASQTYLFAYLGTAGNGEHLFMVYVAASDEDSTGDLESAPEETPR